MKWLNYFGIALLGGVFLGCAVFAACMAVYLVWVIPDWITESPGWKVCIFLTEIGIIVGIIGGIGSYYDELKDIAAKKKEDDLTPPNQARR